MAVGHKRFTPDEQAVDRIDEQQFPGMNGIYRAVYAQCREVHRSDLHYLGDALDNVSDSVYVSVSHLNSKGNQVIADRLYDILKHLPPSNLTQNSGTLSRSGNVVPSPPELSNR
jgi:hypothetical protein